MFLPLRISQSTRIVRLPRRLVIMYHIIRRSIMRQNIMLTIITRVVVRQLLQVLSEAR
jgi:hypothetical protein